MALHLTPRELATLSYIVRHSDHPRSCELEGLINDEIESEREKRRAAMRRYLQELPD